MDRFEFTKALRRRKIIRKCNVDYIDSHDTTVDLHNDCNKFLTLVVEAIDMEIFYPTIRKPERARSRSMIVK